MIRHLLLLVCCFCARAAVLEFPSQIDNLQQALDQTEPGDTVLVARGCWPVHLVTPDRDLTLCSNYLFSGDTTDILETQLDGELTGTVLTIRNTDPHFCRVVGFTIQHGMGMRRPDDPPHDFAGGIHIRELSEGELEHLRFRWNRTQSSSAAIDINSIGGYFMIDGEYIGLYPRAARVKACHVVLDDMETTPSFRQNVRIYVVDSLEVRDFHVSMVGDSVAGTAFSFSSDTYTRVEDVDFHNLHLFGNSGYNVFSVGSEFDLDVQGVRMTHIHNYRTLLNIASDRDVRVRDVEISDNTVSDDPLNYDASFCAMIHSESMTTVDGLVFERCSSRSWRLLGIVGGRLGELSNFRFNDNVTDPGDEDTLYSAGPGRAMATRRMNLRHGELCRNTSVAPKYLVDYGDGVLHEVHAVSKALLEAEFSDTEGTFVFEDLLCEGNEVIDLDDPYNYFSRGTRCPFRVLTISVYAYCHPCRLELRNLRVLHNRYENMEYTWPFDPNLRLVHVGSTVSAGARQMLGLSKGDMLVEDCLFVDNDDGASEFSARRLTVRNCQYIDNNRYALRASGIPAPYDSVCFARVQNVLIQNTDTLRIFPGVAYDIGEQDPLVVSSDSVHVENVTLVDCNTKFLTQESNTYNIRIRPRYSVWRNILVNNCSYISLGHELHEWYYGDEYTPPFTYSCLQEAQPGEGNFVVADARFDEQRGVPYLASNSPCVDAGDPDPSWQDLPDSEIPAIALWPGLGGLRCDIGYTGGPLAPGDPWLAVPPLKAATLPASPTLGDAYPNPFNPVTTIPFVIQAPTHLRLSAYNLCGQLVADLAEGDFMPGEHQVRFDGQALASGVYFITLRTEDVAQTRKVLLLK